MSFIKLSGNAKEEYLTKLDKSLETITQIDTGINADIENIKKIITFFSFGEFYGALKNVEIDIESGLPFMTSIQDLIINKKKAHRVLAKHSDEATIRRRIRDSCYNNNFDVAKLQQELKIIDFYQDLIKGDIIYKQKTTLEEVTEKEDDIISFKVKVKGYDGAKMSWTFYDMDIFQKGNRTACLKKGKLTDNFDADFSFSFGFGPEFVYKRLKAHRKVVPTVITRTILKGFYFLGKDNEPFENIFINKPDASMLVIETSTMEDTDVLLSEELDKEVLSKKYYENNKETFINETKRLYACSEDIQERVKEYALRDKHEFKIVTY